MGISFFSLNDQLLALGLGLTAGLFLTLMDRIDEHRIVERCRTVLAYLAAVCTSSTMAWSIELFPVLYPLLFGMCLGWIIKNKVNFPSHVFSLFLLALYFGWRLDLLLHYYPYIALFMAIRYLSGTWLRQKLSGRPGFFHWYYASYWEKLVCNIVLASVLLSPLVAVYAAGFTAACLYTKRGLPEPVRNG